MARARNIKPSLFKNEVLGIKDPLITVLFISLWCLADREGRLEDRPLRIKAETFPYREIDAPLFNGYLTELARCGFIHRYKAGDNHYIQVVNFTKHQSPHKTERPSEIPPYSDSCAITVNAPLNNGSLTVKESLNHESVNHESLGKQGPTRKANGTRFQPPTLVEITAYCRERNNRVDPSAWIDHYTSNGWKVGKNPMKDWKAAVRTWERTHTADKRQVAQDDYGAGGI